MKKELIAKADDLALDFSRTKYGDYAGVPVLRSWRDGFYEWRDGCWNAISDTEIKRLVTSHIQKIDADRDERDRIGITTQRVNNVLLCLKGYHGIAEAVEPNSWFFGKTSDTVVSVKNGLLYLSEEPKLDKHTPQYFNLYSLSYEYDPGAGCPRWMDFLAEAMEGKADYVRLLQQWSGYLFRPDLREQRFLLCVGEGANGKGVFFEVVQALVGKDNCSQVPLTEFGDRFALYNTVGKVVNMTTESSHMVEDKVETTLKGYVAGDRFTFQRKFKEPIHAVPTAKIMVATNALPRFGDKTQAVWRRILLVPFNKVIPEDQQIKNLAEQLNDELPGILNWAIDGLHDLNKHGFVVPEASHAALEEYRRDADPARAFLLDYCVVSPNGESVLCSELYREYAEFCRLNNYAPLHERNFGRQVRRVFPCVARVQRGGRADRKWVYQGVTLVHEETETPFLRP